MAETFTSPCRVVETSRLACLSVTVTAPSVAWRDASIPEAPRPTGETVRVSEGYVVLLMTAPLGRSNPGGERSPAATQAVPSQTVTSMSMVPGWNRTRTGLCRAQESLTACLEGGRLWADLEINFSWKYPSLTLSSHLEGVKTGPLFQALKEPAWNLDGILNLRSTITFQGPTPWGLGTASGWGSLTLEKGRLKGSKAFDRLVEAFASFLRLERGEGRLQEFDRLQGEFALEKGFVRTRNLSVSKG
ncbi:MAG: AsmA-like C-terminal region-containing protein, partial [Candidatus Methylomirabilales bacterium]